MHVKVETEINRCFSLLRICSAGVKFIGTEREGVTAQPLVDNSMHVCNPTPIKE